MKIIRPFWLTPAVVLLCSTAPSWSQTVDTPKMNSGEKQTEETFKINASETIMTDSNLFRLSDSADLNALIGRSSAAEKINITTLGLSINKAYSLQRFELDMDLIDYRYQNFSYLSFTAKNYNAAWRWSLTPRLTGNLTTDRKETLNSFTDVQSFNQRNQRTNTKTRFDGAYELDGAWAVLGGVEQSAQTNQEALVAEGDYKANSADVGLRYTFASGSALTYTLKNTSGTYVNRAMSPGNLLDDGYNQLDNELKLHWLISGKSTADLTTAYINRTHPHFGERDYSGFTAGAKINWSMTAKTALSAGWLRELASYQTGSANYSQTDSFSIEPTWQMSPKTIVSLRYQVAQRDYKGTPTAVSAPQRSETLTDTTLSFDWQPYRYLSLSTSLGKAKRTANLPGLDYDSNMVNFSAKFSF